MSGAFARLPDSRGPSAIGRTARLELVFDARTGRTRLAHSYAEPPFRVGRTFEIDGAAYVILVCAGPGVFAGDALHLSLHVGPGARVIVTSQSALQVHPSAARSPATIRHRYVVDDEGELHAHWDPVIPFAGARLDQRFDLEVAESSRVYWSDALMSGRVRRAEQWQFDSVAHELRVRIGARLKYLERYTLAPSQHAIAHPWIAGNADYLATAITYHERATTDAAESLQREVEADATAGVQVGVDLVDSRLLLGRLLGSAGAPFAEARASYRERVQAMIFDRPHQALRK